MSFKNMKIAITDEVQLKAVCDVLESMGIVEAYKTKASITTVIFDENHYSLLGLLFELIDDWHPINLTDLLAMRDEMFKNKILEKAND